VPAALTKDKKRLRGHEVAVHLAWKSTLYVTNFPEKADDTSMRALFGQVSPDAISFFGLEKNLTRTSMERYLTFDGRVRNSRIRGGFVMFSTPHRCVIVRAFKICVYRMLYPQISAEKALELHERELEPGHPMNVLLSNPERKKERTDTDANEREIYVAGLSKFTTKGDLENLFKTVRCAGFLCHGRF
jgi:squamous cell carcinoma antigen recognized by T-cells 3